MNRSPEETSAWRALSAPQRTPAVRGPQFDVGEIHAHRARRAAHVRRQTGRANAEGRTAALIAALVLVADAVLMGAGAVAAGFRSDGWLAWPLLLLAMVGGICVVLSAVAAGLGLWCGRPGAGGSAGLALVSPGQAAVALANAAALRTRLNQTTEAELERLGEEEWLRAAQAARAQWRAVIWAAALAIGGLALLAIAALNPPVG